ncbi:hypothetical protein EV356DRAFT_500804 [Viridothelium virens]|uniref:Uncharacterized protein n=1 Tax=Viridothelium virens TaxID=1048519 RepID=A0A6A6HAY3_VIRVR|nr:hypothetical protein EV356DRAFT_500804 [Viridothelium virens]
MHICNAVQASSQYRGVLKFGVLVSKTPHFGKGSKSAHGKPDKIFQPFLSTLGSILSGAV